MAPLSAIASVRLLSAGWCAHPEAMTRCGAPWKPARFPSGFALLVHRERGPVLFDTGYAARFAGATERFPERLYRWLTPVSLPAGRSAVEQLGALGIAPGDVRAVVVSHFHADHVAGLRDFPRAAVICSRAAWESVRGLRGFRAVRNGFLRALLPEDVETRLSFVEDRPALEASGALRRFGVLRDLFGDGSVLAVELPGHAAGQIGLYLPETPDGALLFAADAAWSEAAYEEALAPPPAITTRVLGETTRYRETLRKLADLRRERPDVRIVPAHSQRLFASEPH